METLAAMLGSHAAGEGVLKISGLIDLSFALAVLWYPASSILVLAYHRYFSHEEIKAMLAFYSTPAGQKTISVMPQMAQESLALWAQRLRPVLEQRIKARLKQRGIDL
jgi:hypothetical protein